MIEEASEPNRLDLCWTIFNESSQNWPFL